MGMYGTYYSDMVNRRTAVYKLYDTAGQLLYVGLSLNPHTRISSHRRKPWGHMVARTEVDWFDGREAAKDAERHAIFHENPIHNVTRPRECC